MPWRRGLGRAVVPAPRRRSGCIRVSRFGSHIWGRNLGPVYLLIGTALRVIPYPGKPYSKADAKQTNNHECRYPVFVFLFLWHSQAHVYSHSPK